MWYTYFNVKRTSVFPSFMPFLWIRLRVFFKNCLSSFTSISTLSSLLMMTWKSTLQLYLAFRWKNLSILLYLSWMSCALLLPDFALCSLSVKTSMVLWGFHVLLGRWDPGAVHSNLCRKWSVSCCRPIRGALCEKAFMKYYIHILNETEFQVMLWFKKCGLIFYLKNNWGSLFFWQR
jgi:hypothetical protein